MPQHASKYLAPFSFALLALNSGIGDSRAEAIRPGYNISDLGVLPGTTQSAATGINALGQVVGVSYTERDSSSKTYDTGAKSFRYSDGVLSPVNPAGGPATAINDSGFIVGGRDVADNDSGQFVRAPSVREEPSIVFTGSTETPVPGFVARDI